MRPAFPAPDYYGASAPHGALGRRRPCPPFRAGRAGRGRHRTVPTFIFSRSTGEAPSSTPAVSPRVTPQTFTVASWPVITWRPGSSPPPAGSGCAPATSPYPPDLSWWAVKGRQSLVSRVHLPVSLTGPAPSDSADPSRLCQGCFHPTQRLPSQAAPSFTRPLRRSGRRRSLTSARLQTPRGAHGLQPSRHRRTTPCNLHTSPGPEPSSAEETSSVLMVKCSPATTRGTTSQQRSHLLTASGHTVCCKTSPRIRAHEC
jgi:hypothetical protein